jgi:uncharacterized membrane protein YeaQ/YmgE (transglycosylase-associated protein family)
LLDRLSCLLATEDEEIVIFSHKVTGIALGALVFWLTFLFVQLIAGVEYGGKSVGFLTLIAPMSTWAVIYVLYDKILPRERSGVMPAVFVGVLGPLLGTWVYSLITIVVPAWSSSPSLNTASDFLWEIFSIGVTGPLAVLTYTGMLGAVILNLAASPLLGFWFSRRK